MLVPANATPVEPPVIANGHDRELKVMTFPGQPLEWGGLAQGGDDKLTWSSDDPNQVTMAKEAFNEYRTKGYKMFKSGSIGGKKIGEEITEFDSNIERMIAVPPMKGG